MVFFVHETAKKSDSTTDVVTCRLVVRWKTAPPFGSVGRHPKSAYAISYKIERRQTDMQTGNSFLQLCGVGHSRRIVTTSRGDDTIAHDNNPQLSLSRGQRQEIDE